MSIPTKEIAKHAALGLQMRRTYNRGGTAVGVARARDLSNRVNVSPSTIARMFSFFSRHSIDKNAQGFYKGESGYPSKGRIAWELWGGDPGFTWSKKMRMKKNPSTMLSTWNAISTPQKAELVRIIRALLKEGLSKSNIVQYMSDAGLQPHFAKWVITHFDWS